MFISKLIFGLLSAQLAKWLGEHPAMGLIIGVFFGHIIDMLISRKISEWQYRRKYIKKAQKKANEDFLYCLFTLAGKVCSTDNVICQKEHEKIEEIVSERLTLGRRDRKLALSHFKDSHKKQTSPQNLAISLVDLCQNTPDMLKNTILLLKEIALADGPVNQPEYSILFTLSSVFGFDPDTTVSMIGHKPADTSQSSSNNNSTHSKNGSDQRKVSPEQEALHNQLKILGCKPGDTNDKIKRNYRELVAKFHPDKIQSKELPEDFIDFAKTRFTEVRKAYEEVKKIKGF
jgi:DnaJ like chaperone protein